MWAWDSESDAEVTAPACDEGLLRVVHQWHVATHLLYTWIGSEIQSANNFSFYFVHGHFHFDSMNAKWFPRKQNTFRLYWQVWTHFFRVSITLQYFTWLVFVSSKSNCVPTKVLLVFKRFITCDQALFGNSSKLRLCDVFESFTNDSKSQW